MAIERPTNDLVTAVSALQSLLLSTPAIGDLLTELAGLAVSTVDPAVSCGITLEHDHSPYTVAASDARAVIIDEYQYGGGTGPCLEALRTGLMVLVDDQETDPRWPEYRAAAIALGVRSSLSLPLMVGEASLGAMNIYAQSGPGAFGEEQITRARVFADQAAAALALAIRQIEQQETARQLEQALVARTLIDQAIGMLMAQQRCDAETAFHLLREHSQHSNRKLRDVAAELIERCSGHPPVPPAGFEHRADPHGPQR